MTFPVGQDIGFYWWGQFIMEDFWEYSIRSSLLRVGDSCICHSWEIYKYLFVLHNIKPIWINLWRGDYDYVMRNLYKVFFNHSLDINENSNILIVAILVV